MCALWILGFLSLSCVLRRARPNLNFLAPKRLQSLKFTFRIKLQSHMARIKKLMQGTLCTVYVAFNVNDTIMKQSLYG